MDKQLIIVCSVSVLLAVIVSYFLFNKECKEKECKEKECKECKDPRIVAYPKIPSGCELPPHVYDITPEKYKIVSFDLPEAKMREKYGSNDPTGKDGWKTWASTGGTYLCKKDGSVGWHLGSPAYKLIMEAGPGNWTIGLSTTPVITDPNSPELPKKICGQVDRLNLYFPRHLL
jgi:hypothetical protein